MRITCEVVAGGNMYRFYRTDDTFHRDLKALVPLLLQAGVPLEVGSSEHHADVLLTAGPFAGGTDAAFIEKAGKHLAT